MRAAKGGLPLEEQRRRVMKKTMRLVMKLQRAVQRTGRRRRCARRVLVVAESRRRGE